MNSSHKNDEVAVHEEPEQPGGIAGCGQQHKPTSTALLAILVLAVAGIVLVTHWPALSAQALSFDDNQYLTENQLVQDPSWSSAIQFLSEVLKPSTVKGYYQPLTMISLMADYAIAGRVDNLQPFHRTSLCLHVMNTALVVVLLYMLFGQVWVAAIVGLLFGIHPLTVETIPWICERKTLLATFFTFWSLVLYIFYTRKGNRAAYTACLLMYVMALMSKPTSTPLPLLLLLLDYWPLRRLNWRTLAEKLSFFVIGGIAAVITFISQTRAAWTALPTQYPRTAIPLIVCHNIRFYLHKIVWPVNLSPHYSFPEPLALSHPEVLAGVVSTCILIAVLLLSLRHTRSLLVGFLFFLLAILPTMQIIGFSNSIASNRYVYLPSLGLLLPLTWFLSQFWSALSRMSRQAVRQVGTVIVVIVLAGGEAAAARSYLSHWKDTESLFRYMVALAPDAPRLHMGLGKGLIEKGKIDEAIEVHRKELRINPDYYKAINNLAVLLARKGQTTEAIKYFSRAVQLKPDDFKSHYNLGAMLSKQGNFDRAIGHFRQAVRIQPHNANAHYNLGALLSYRGRIDEAIEEFRAALEINPAFVQARTALNAALAKKSAKRPKAPPE